MGTAVVDARRAYHRQRMQRLGVLSMLLERQRCAIADRDLDSLAAVTDEEQRVIRTLQQIQRGMAALPGSAEDPHLRQEFEDLRVRVVGLQARNRVLLAHLHQETGRLLKETRIPRRGRAVYAQPETATKINVVM